MTDRPPAGAGRLSNAVRLLPGPLHRLYMSGLRRVSAHRIRRNVRPSRVKLSQALDEILQRWDPASLGSPSDAPIFIFGAGWRCGSTWLQRIVMSSGQVQVWGEPFDRSAIVQTMTSQLLPLSQAWPPEKWFVRSEAAAVLADQWVANLYPPVPTLIEAHRGFFRELFEAPARERGIARWGFKEVRLTTDHARYLRLLFPQAKFVFLVRNPFDAYRSYREAHQPWFERWPDRLTVTARQFGRMWSALANDFVQGHVGVQGLLLRYEDLVSEPSTLKQVSDYLDLALLPDRAAREIRANPHRKEPLSALERWLLSGEVRQLSRHFGYA